MATAPRLPDYRGGQPTALRGGRLPASEINRMAPTVRERTISVAAHGEPIPIVYGRTNVPGKLFAQGMISTDLVLGYALCVGEIDAIEMVQINDVDASTITGVTVTTYLGTASQTVNSTLSTAITAFNDSMRFDAGNGLRGIAYVVLRITTDAAVGGWPRLRATVRGRKVYDPRTGLTAYSDNTALCMADLITDVDYGIRMTVTNLTAAADWCDSLLADDTTKRSRLALALNDPSPIDPDWLRLFSAYAECYYVYEGSNIRLIPDGAVDLTAAPIVTQWMAESLRIRREDSSDAPTAVDVVYTVPRSDALPWATTTVRRSESGDLSTPTTVSMPGVFSSAEADNKALARVNRARQKTNISFVAPDVGVTYQTGDVIRLQNDARGITDLPMRVLAITMTEPGRYQVSGERYDVSQYPSETPPVSGSELPAGGIILWTGGATPANFTAVTAANDKLIVGAGGTYAQSATGGSGWSVTFSGSTTTNGAHSTGPSGFSSPREVFGGSRVETTYEVGSSGSPSHSHTYNSGAVTLTPKLAKIRLIKATTAQANIPLGGKVFGLAGIVSGGWSRDTGKAGRVLSAAAADADTGSDSQTAAITTGSASDAHRHTTTPTNSAQAAFATADLFSSLSGGGSHTHTVTLSIAAALKRRKLALYQTTSDIALVPGHIIMWEGGAVPVGWLLCDGTKDTPDMRDYFVEISGTGSEGTAAGDNTATATGTTNQKGHSHRGGDVSNDVTAIGVVHGGTVYHSHTISGSAAISPPYYALAFLMYSPGS